MVSEQIVPQLSSIYLNLTERCNLRCQHCWINPEFYASGFTPVKRTEGELDVKEIELIIKQSLKLGLKSVKLTGGEPFLRKDIFKIIELIKKYKLKLHIETNGTIMDLNDIRFVKKYHVDSFSISLDSTNQSTHELIRGVADSFEKTIRTIKLLTGSGISVEIIISLFNQNLNDFPYIFKFAKKTGINNIKLNTIIPTGRGAILYKKGLVPDLPTLIEFNKKIEQYIDNKIHVHFSLPPIFKSIDGLVHDGNANCRIFNILGILSNGDISICGIGRLEKSLIMGNIRKDRIKDIWTNNPILKLLRNDLPNSLKGICKKCIFRYTCIGFCRANAYSVSKDLLAPYWLCEEAFNMGLFPVRRLM